MGVPGFSTWFSKKAAAEAFLPLQVGKPGFDHVYVDLASVLHGVLRHGVFLPLSAACIAYACLDKRRLLCISNIIVSHLAGIQDYSLLVKARKRRAGCKAEVASQNNSSIVCRWPCGLGCLGTMHSRETLYLIF